jgi:hypothetical protein
MVLDRNQHRSHNIATTYVCNKSFETDLEFKYRVTTLLSLKDVNNDPSSRTMALGSTRPLTEMNLPVGKGRPARGADVTAICETNV